MIKTYSPVILTLVLVIALGLYTAFIRTPFGDVRLFVQDTLGFFFVIFGFFKCLDLRGFAGHFSQYDIIARAIPAYAFVYPFIELGLGIAYLMDMSVAVTAVLTLVILGIREIGIIQTVMQKRDIPCGCMGTTALFPINYATVAANIVTLGAAVYLIFY